MATRDRTALFLRYREEARALHRLSNKKNDDRVDDGALQDAEHGNSTMRRPNLIRGGMQPDWLFAYNDLNGDFSELEQMLEQLSALYSRHLLPSFGETDTSQLEHDIRLQSHSLTKLLHAVEHKLRQLSTRRDAAHGNGNDDVEVAIRNNMQKRFATPLQQFSMSFRKKQKTYLEKLKEQKQLLSNAPDSKYNPVVEVGQSEQTDLYDSGFSEMQLLNVENSSAMAEERTRELNQIAANINDLATIVKDIASLVVDQGTVLDRVDYNLEDVKLTTMSAVQELRIADRYQRKRHTLCCIIVLAVACGVMFMILVFKWTS